MIFFIIIIQQLTSSLRENSLSPKSHMFGMSHGFLFCNYISLLSLFWLLDCLNFVPETPFCLVSVSFGHLPIIVIKAFLFPGTAVCFRLISHFSALGHVFIQSLFPFSSEGAYLDAKRYSLCY